MSARLPQAGAASPSGGGRATLQFNRPKTHKPELAPPPVSSAREQHAAFLRKSLGFDSDSDESDDDIAIAGVDDDDGAGQMVPVEQVKALEEQLSRERQSKDESVKLKHTAEEDARKNGELLRRLEQRVKMQMSMLRSGYDNQLKQRDMSLRDMQLSLSEVSSHYREASSKLQNFDASFQAVEVLEPSIPSQATGSQELADARRALEVNVDTIREASDPEKLKAVIFELLESSSTLADALVKLEPDITANNSQVTKEALEALTADLAQVRMTLAETEQELEKSKANGGTPNVDDKVKAVLIKLKTDNKDLKKKLKALKKAYLALEAKGGGGGGGGAAVGPPAGMSQSDFDELVAAFKETKKKNKELTKACKMLQAQVAGGGGGGGGGAGEGNGAALNGNIDAYKAELKKYKQRIAALEAEQANGGSSGAATAAEVEKLNEKYKKMKETAQQYKDAVKKAEKELEKVNAGAAASSVDLEAKNKRIADLQQQLQAFEGLSKMVPTMRKIAGEFGALKADFVAVKRDFGEHHSSLGPTFASVKQSFDQQLVAHDAELNKAIERYRKESKLRRKLYNDLQDLRGNIRVYARVRPVSEKEKKNPAFKMSVRFGDDTEITLLNSIQSTQKTFEFDRVFDFHSTQEQVFEDTEPLVTSVVDGYNVCIFAYGQTGSGKTYTMEGPPNDRGVNFRSLSELFRILKSREEEYEFSLEVAVLEIYNETIRDLLADPNQPRKKLEIRQSPQGSYVQDLTSLPVRTEEDIMQVMQTGHSNRSVGSTDMNEHSSRSHAMLQIVVKSKNRFVGTETKGKLTLCDLAGSERVSKSKATGSRMTEAQNINKSLSALGDVIAALSSKNSHIPYRNSKLTHLLQDSLGGNSKVLMFIQISPADENAPESMCTLNFAQRAKNVELGKAKKHGDDAEGAYFRRVSEMLKGTLAANGIALPDLPPPPSGVKP